MIIDHFLIIFSRTWSCNSGSESLVQ